MNIKALKGLYTLNTIYFIMCFEFEIPNKKKDKTLNTIEEDLDVEPELEKVQEPVTVSVK
jgi:hypothetical protein